MRIQGTQQKNFGFTLIEVLLVIGIIGILASVIIVAINPARQFALARNVQREANINSIMNAVSAYLAEHQGVIPEDFPTYSTDICRKPHPNGVDNCAVTAGFDLDFFLGEGEYFNLMP